MHERAGKVHLNDDPSTHVMGAFSEGMLIGDNREEGRGNKEKGTHALAARTNIMAK
jgi:hypothetical protein